MSLFLNQEDGYYSLTGTGTIAFVVIIVILIALTALLKNKESSTETRNTKVFSTKQLVFSAVAIAQVIAASSFMVRCSI